MKGSARAVMLALAVVAALGSMAIHMLVPALPLMARDLGVGTAQAQATISVYMIGLGAAQLIAGPAVDRLGRRPVLLTGLMLYALGALACALATGLPMLLAGRAVQAMGGAAGVVTARVMVGDLFGREEAAERQASLMTIVLISPALAPVAGGLLASGLGWRAIPAVLAVVALGVLGLTARRLPKRSAAGAGRRALRQEYALLLRNRRFALATAAMAMGSSTLYMFLASAPFLLHDEGLEPRAIGLALLTVAVASIAGTRLVSLLARGGHALLAGTTLILAGTLIEAGLALGGWHGPAALLAPMLLVGLGAGVAGPAAMAIVVFAEEGLAGTTTSLAGATQMLTSAGATLALGLVAPISASRLALMLLASSALGFAAALAGGRAKRSPHEYEQ